MSLCLIVGGVIGHLTSKLDWETSTSLESFKHQTRITDMFKKWRGLKNGERNTIEIQHHLAFPQLSMPFWVWDPFMNGKACCSFFHASPAKIPLNVQQVLRWISTNFRIHGCPQPLLCPLKWQAFHPRRSNQTRP